VGSAANRLVGPPHPTLSPRPAGGEGKAPQPCPLAGEKGGALGQGGLHVEVGDIEGVGLDEIAAGLDEVAHQGREGLLGRVGVVDLDLE
jgi:hypothetical protein